MQKGDIGRISKRAFQQTLNPKEEKSLQHCAGIQGISSLIPDI